jgi:hypothetical protein
MHVNRPNLTALTTTQRLNLTDLNPGPCSPDQIHIHIIKYGKLTRKNKMHVGGTDIEVDEMVEEVGNAWRGCRV